MLPQHHNGKRSNPILDPTPVGPNESAAASFQPPPDRAEGLAGSDILRLHRKGSKVWSDLRDRLKATGRAKGRNSHGSQSSVQAPEWCQDETLRPLNKGKSPAVIVPGSGASMLRKAKGFPTANGFMRKLRPENLKISSHSPVMARRSPSQQKDSFQDLPIVTESDGSSGKDDIWSSAHSSRLASPEDILTGKTSIDSRFSISPSAKGSPRRKLSRRSRWTRSSPEGAGLGTIEESTADKPKPTILTVERAAAAKIYLETHFNELCSEPHRRSIRRQNFERRPLYNPYMSQANTPFSYNRFYYQESCRLRDIRALKSKCTIQAKRQNVSPFTSQYEPLKILGKGSFGIVRLVREKSDSPYPYSNRVYAMKVIRKSDMLRSSQEGHLRAERDFLVTYEGSKWVVPLIASFDDLSNLYLVMEYMPGGDFLGLLIRENILHEAVACFYVAEMILAVEEAHRLGFIHRDIKPDNFLISSSGHLKISDFGLAFDGQWPHDASYYNYHRYSLLRKLNLDAKGDEKDQEDNKSVQGQVEKAQALTGNLGRHDEQSLGSDQDLATVLGWRNMCGNRTRANSVVGTSQYMAPESIGIILFECLYGHTPFLSDEGRKPTKQNILAHKEKFRFPARPFVSDKCKDLIYRLIQDKEVRLCSKRYQMLDQNQPGAGTPTDTYGRYVFPNDAEDIKAHRFFRMIPWDLIQTITPPFIPHINSLEDTHYFDESEPLDDRMGSASERPGLTDDEVRWLLREFRPSIQNVAIRLINTPYDSGALRSRDLEIDSMSAFLDEEKELLKRFMREYGQRAPKRPRDIILRDENMKDAAMEVRKQSAFIGYAWHSAKQRAY
ncbi:agc ndr kinase [Trichoderma cornu-damae]|uniref:non-specific serine/threonine protein kinase n=1 Tax=Trichoderma cornu-damae TaxID=654480 RepID=A0A9P8QU87_9HYPO|nr:agc ndr kinase [Trichoderma cornu-damae]